MTQFDQMISRLMTWKNGNDADRGITIKDCKIINSPPWASPLDGYITVLIKAADVAPKHEPRLQDSELTRLGDLLKATTDLQADISRVLIQGYGEGVGDLRRPLIYKLKTVNKLAGEMYKAGDLPVNINDFKPEVVDGVVKSVPKRLDLTDARPKGPALNGPVGRLP